MVALVALRRVRCGRVQRSLLGWRALNLGGEHRWLGQQVRQGSLAGRTPSQLLGNVGLCASESFGELEHLDKRPSAAARYRGGGTAGLNPRAGLGTAGPQPGAGHARAGLTPPERAGTRQAGGKGGRRDGRLCAACAPRGWGLQAAEGPARDLETTECEGQQCRKPDGGSASPPGSRVPPREGPIPGLPRRQMPRAPSPAPAGLQEEEMRRRWGGGGRVGGDRALSLLLTVEAKAKDRKRRRGIKIKRGEREWKKTKPSFCRCCLDWIWFEFPLGWLE